MQIIIKVMSDEGVLLQKRESMNWESAEEALGKMARYDEEMHELEAEREDIGGHIEDRGDIRGYNENR